MLLADLALTTPEVIGAVVAAAVAAIGGVAAWRASTEAERFRGWLICPVIGDGADFPLDELGEAIVTTDRGPFRAAVADREAIDGDRLEFVIGESDTCLVAFDVADPSNFGYDYVLEGELGLQAEGYPGTVREAIQVTGEEITPDEVTFDPDAYLGAADAPPTGSFVEDTMTGGAGAITGHTGEKGATWTAGKGSENTPNLDGAGYAVRAGAQVYEYAYASGSPASADYTVECGVFCSTAVAAKRSQGPMGRVSTEADTSYQMVWETNVGYSLLKRVAGVETVLGTYARVGTAGEEDKVVLSMVGTAIKGFVQKPGEEKGVERISATDSAISAAGKAGFRVSGTTSTSGKVNYIIATDAEVKKEPPEVETKAASEVEQTKAALNGTVDPNGKATTYWFEYGKEETLGTKTTEESGGEGTEPAARQVKLTGLSAATEYFFRVVAKNADGEAKGAILNFTTKEEEKKEEGSTGLPLRPLNRHRNPIFTP